MKAVSKFNRRSILRGLVGGVAVTIGLPPLERFMNTHGTAWAEDKSDGFPRRFGLFFWGNGVIPDRWVPKTTGTDWELSDQLMPLAAHRERLTVVSGMRVGVPNTEPHFATACGFLSGRPILKTGSDHTFSGPSIDQVIAQAIGQETRFASLEFGAHNSQGLSFNAPNSKNPPETNPLLFFERIFGGSFALPGSEPKLDPSIALRRSVLDGVMEQLSSVKASVGAADRIRLEQHFEGLRSLEKRLAKLEEDPPNLAACALPTKPLDDYPEIEGRPQLFEKNKALSEIAAMAMACDQTRVFSSWFTSPVSNVLFTGASSGHHELTHNEPGDQPEVHKITVQCVEAFAQMLDALSKVEEGSGTLLDHCVVLGTTDVSLAKTHSPEDFPIALVGSAGGKLKTGLHYRSSSNENSSKVLLSVARAMGLDLADFGAAEGFTDVGLSDIEV